MAWVIRVCHLDTLCVSDSQHKENVTWQTLKLQDKFLFYELFERQ